MNTTKHTEVNRRRTLVATAVAFMLVVACTAVPIRAEGVAAAQSEADKTQVATARAEGAEQKGVPDHVRSEADAVHVGAASSEAQGAETQRQLDLLHATRADHGLVLTLGDVLFTSGRADVKRGAVGNLSRLVNFLDKYPDRRVVIHGYTDSLGSEEYNQGLSERRANSVKAYLTARGIDSRRLSVSGMGQSDPVASNDSGVGRQQNRRVEVIISDPPVALTQRARTAKLLALFALIEALSGNPGRPLP